MSDIDIIGSISLKNWHAELDNDEEAKERLRQMYEKIPKDSLVYQLAQCYAAFKRDQLKKEKIEKKPE
jgi:hypothetical protein